jgi:hypothetical protein
MVPESKSVLAKLATLESRTRMVALALSVVEISATQSTGTSAPRSAVMVAVLPINRARRRGCGSCRFVIGMVVMVACTDATLPMFLDTSFKTSGIDRDDRGWVGIRREKNWVFGG